MADLTFKITLAGPSRIGKTSLLTTILSQGQDLFAGTKVAFKPGDTPTEARINENQNELRACLMTDEFNVASLSATQNLVNFRLDMTVSKSKIKLDILDFPGEWLRPELRNDEKGWEEYNAWIKESSVLLVPIEATLIMEAMSTRREKGFMIENLQISSITNIVRDWAKARSQVDSPSLLIFAPVKCETYFKENNGSSDFSEELFDKAMDEQLYGYILKVAQDETKNNHFPLQVQYHPVGTLGCVDFKHGFFDKQGVFKATYDRRDNADFHPYGADGILISIARHAAKYLEKSRGFWATLFGIFGENKELAAAIQDLAKKEFHSRVKIIQEK